jgi:1-aminocyclopropane-1-carboxylate deaminase/D-cysteine desulfhydrase-like pyridoxal-dependent ACC family enzyme
MLYDPAVATALAQLMSLPLVPLAPHPTPVDELTRLRAALGPRAPRLLMKRDDLLSFAMGGNKVRKIQAVAAEARAAGADLLITCGGVQSNHARVTAAAGAALGMKVVLVLNGPAPAKATANTLLDQLFGAEIRYVPSREERAPTMEAVAREATAAGRRPFVVPLGASTPIGALGFARGVAELVTAGHRPGTLMSATSSGGTQAGLIAGAALLGLDSHVIGISADDPAASLARTIGALLDGMAERLGAKPASLHRNRPIDVDDGFVGAGYGVPTAESTEAIELVARTEGILLDPVYTAKAMAGLIARVRADAFSPDDTVLFWHTGGQVTNFI